MARPLPLDRHDRQQAAREFRRANLLIAAQQVFADAGLEGATIRAIAQAAGYTPGAVYSYYPTKEAIYADILSHSLTALGAAVRDAAAAAHSDEARLRAAVRAFYDYYYDRPQELDLGFYLFQGIRPRGLTPALDRVLNNRLVAVLQIIAAAMARYAGVAHLDAHRETVAAMCHICGVLLMANTGRLRTLDSEPAALVDHYLDCLVARLRPR
ncbi:MAG: TetR/AcrR family transcriptional regulator [Rhodospirillales bacterium]|nr:TetR/AcrR family transcriptional regulator [Rhodospirillales bacterium]